jgi:hypothetical protein
MGNCPSNGMRLGSVYRVRTLEQWRTPFEWNEARVGLSRWEQVNNGELPFQCNEAMVGLSRWEQLNNGELPFQWNEARVGLSRWEQLNSGELPFVWNEARVGLSLWEQLNNGELPFVWNEAWVGLSRWEQLNSGELPFQWNEAMVGLSRWEQLNIGELPFVWNEARVGLSRWEHLSVVKTWIISERYQFGLTAGVGQLLGGGRSIKTVRFERFHFYIFACLDYQKSTKFCLLRQLVGRPVSFPRLRDENQQVREDRPLLHEASGATWTAVSDLLSGWVVTILTGPDAEVGVVIHTAHEVLTTPTVSNNLVW